MTLSTIRRGTLYRCPVCKAEITVIRRSPPDFVPRCCNTNMVRLNRTAAFYRCPVCGAEIAHIRLGDPAFTPRCCNTDMVRLAA